MSADVEKRIAVYPGTFDPVTNGHISLIERAVRIFDEVVVAVARNTAGKQSMFTCDERFDLMKRSVEDTASAGRIRVIKYEGLTAKLVQDIGARAIIRGLRAVSDFEYEFQMALMNRRQAHEIETVFLMPALSWVYLSSSMVKDVARHGGDIEGLVPDPVREAMLKKLKPSADEPLLP
jgi:pantetheine-phosphate adenylyltransferase